MQVLVDSIAMTPRETLGLCCVHIAQLMTHSAIYTIPFTVMLQASWYTAEGNWESKGSYIKSWWIAKTSENQLCLTYVSEFPKEWAE